jgi:hypothetical protein
MPTIEIIEGDVLRYPGTGPSHDGGRAHKHVVVKTTISDIYLVPICSAHALCDRTCILDEKTPVIGLSHASYIAYFWGKAKSKRDAAIKILNREIELIGRLPDSVYAKIKAGLLITEEIEPWFKSAVTPPVPPRRILAATE